MTSKEIKVRLRNGRLEPVEKLELPEGAELTVTIGCERRAPEVRQRPVQLRTWNLGIKGPVTREEIYKDAF